MKKNLFKLSFILFIVGFFWLAGQARADDLVTIHLEIQSAAATIYNDFISVSACPEFPDSATTTVNGLCALEQSGLALAMNWKWAPAAFITSIGGASEDATTSTYWLWFSDLNLSNDAVNQHALVAGERLLFTLGTFPLKISASDLSPFDGATTTISVLQFDPAVFDWISASDATVDFGWGATTTDVNGQVDIIATSSMPFSVSASKANLLSSNAIGITPQAAHANITIRDGAAVAFSGIVELPASNAASVDILPTNASSTVAVPARSLLSVLEKLDIAQNEFAIIDLQYYSSYNSFFISCVTVAAEINQLCGSWQYNLNGADPWFGVDQALLKNGDTVFLYFGNQRQVMLSTTATTVGTPFTATAQKYDPANNAYVAIAGVTIGATQPNPNDPWNPLEIAISTVDANGQAVFMLNTAGAYSVGIKEDFYFPLMAITVTAPVLSSGGGSSPAPTAKVDLVKAVDFLTAKQSADGSFGSALITDWAAVALGSFNPNSQPSQKLRSYLLTDPDSLGGMNKVSDYARRAMALMSLNINPYSGTRTNYIKKIIDSFKSGQFGDSSLFNDDIFALIVLNRVGYTADDEMIKQDVNFVMAKQQADGSWGSVDLTAAAIQALKPFSPLSSVGDSIIKARNFLLSAQSADGLPEQAGGFGNISATAWALQAISALGESGDDWRKNGKTPESFLFLSQGADGGLDKNNTEANRVWETAYAIPAIQGKPWFKILDSFAKEEAAAAGEETLPNNSGATDNLIATSTGSVSSRQATSTLELSDLATSSPQELNQASTTEASLTAEADDTIKEIKLIKPGPERIAKSAVKPTKFLAPKVLSVKITEPKPLPAAIDDKSENQTIVQPAENKLTVSAHGGQRLAKKQIVKEKINDSARKVLYVAGAGVIIMGFLLVLKLFGFLL